MSRHASKAAPPQRTEEPDGTKVLAALRRHESELQRTNRALRTLSSCNRALIHATNEKGLLDEVCRVFVEEGGYRMAWVGFAENDGRKTVRPVASAGYEAGYLERVDITWADEPRGRGPTGTAIRTRLAAVCRDMHVDPKFAPWREDALRRGYAASIVLPLLDRDVVLGAVSIYAADPAAFEAEEVGLLQELADNLVFGLLALRARAAHREDQAAVRQAEANNRRLLEASLDPLVTIGPDGRITDVNPATETATGRGRAELIGTDFSDYFTEPEKARAGYLQVFREGSVRNYPLELRHRDGGITAVVYNASVYRDEHGAVIGVFATARDITELKRAEAALRASEVEFRTLAEAMPQIVWATRADGWNIYFNQRWVDYTGLTLEESYGHGWNIPFHPDDQKRSWEAWQQATQHGAIYALEVRLRRKDGEYRWWLVRGVPLQDAEGRILKWFGTCTDIHDLKMAEEEIRRLNTGLEQRVQERTQDLAESEERLRSVLRATATGTFEIDLQTGEGRWNDVEFELLGLKPGDLPPGPETFFRYVHPDDVKPLGAHWEEAKRTGTLDIEFRVIRADGEVRWLAGKGHFAYAPEAGTDSSGPRGMPLRFLGVNYDITGRKLAEQALHQGRLDLDRAQQVAQIGSWRLDVRRNVLTWSDENHRIFGVPPDTPLTYESFLAIIHPEDRAYVDTQWKAGLEGAPYDIEHRIVVDGRVKWVREKAFLEFDPAGRLLGGFGITQDITERKRAEEALRESEQRLALAVDAAQEGVWSWDMVAGRLDWSPQQFRIFGLDPDRTESSFEVWRKALHPADRAAAEAKIHAAIDQHARLENEYRVVLPSGEIRWISALGDTTYDQAGKPVRMSGVCLDITARKRAELELQNLAAELQAANRELESFSYSVSHDLRAPLRAMDGFSRIALTQHTAELSPEAREALQIVRTSSQQMGRLIDELLIFSRLSRQPVRKTTVSSADLVRECLAVLRPETEGRRVEITTGELPACPADPGLLKLVWMNLLSNALKYSRKSDPARIEIGCRRNGETVYFVRDNGVGFDMAYADKLFGVFQRLHRAEDYEGTGVGLATAQRILHRHGGRIWAEAEPGHGATFCFTVGSVEKS